MSKLAFSVQGSAPEPYLVEFERTDDGGIRATCTCPAGASSSPCKHRLDLITTAHDGSDLAAMLSGSSLVAAVNEASAAEQRLEAAKLEVSALKKKVARIMTGRA